jgi:hypothetical protein
MILEANFHSAVLKFQWMIEESNLRVIAVPSLTTGIYSQVSE